MIEIFQIFAKYIVYFSVVISLVCVLGYYRLNPILKIFAIYLIASGCIDILSLTIVNVKRNNLMFLHFFALIEIIVLSKFFEKIFTELNKKIPLRGVYFTAIVLVIGNSIFLQPLDTFNTYSSTIVSLIIISYSVATFYLLLDDTGEKYKAVKWLVAGLFIYHMTTITILFTANLMLSFSADAQLNIWFLRAVVILITKIIFFVVILREVKGPKLKAR